jgi:tetratricopeptide (TPR) repeat protein
MLARNGQVERARAVLAPQLDPNIPADERSEAYLILGRMELEQRRYPQAIDALEKAPQLDPACRAAYRDLAVANYHLGRYARAIENAQAALKYNPRHVECRVLIGECHARQQQWVQAIEELQKARQLDPSNAHTWYLLGQAYAGQHRYAEAADAFRQAAQLRPDPAATVNLAFCLTRLNRTAEAMAILNKVLTDHPDLPQAKALLRELGQ